MVAMVVGDHEVVDPLQVGSVGSCHDAFGITSAEAWPTGVDKHRLAGGGDNQCSLPTLDVDEIDIQILRRRGNLTEAKGQQKSLNGSLDRNPSPSSLFRRQRKLDG